MKYHGFSPVDFYLQKYIFIVLQEEKVFVIFVYNIEYYTTALIKSQLYTFLGDKVKINKHRETSPFLR